ncbi:helix-turn-helix domain-containing protein [Paenibacillus sonchi]|uniref:Helix-turn-helix domain-containing protein n=1 Tax=Paenibacillus sonchi TaxID=373687 RepID=A0A974PD50_9BACL|nr:AraC family transcriptional regulator [Paenibacillus sonchi]QQZ61188.1 helix-turn-helix domain-containing protein [Paenibacillus sonchi]
MKKEFEIIDHPSIKHLNIFLVDMDYRTSHLHRELEIDLVLEGKLDIHSKQQVYRLNPDSSILLNTNQPHEIRTLESKTTILCLQISPHFCKNYFRGISNIVFDSVTLEQHITGDTYTYIKSLMIEMAWQYFARPKGFEFSCMSMLNLLFGVLLNNLPYHQISDDEKNKTMVKVERLTRILNYIDEHYTHKIRLSDIAENEGLSMTYLSQFIKENLNQSFQDYVNNLRFSYAKKLLAEGMKLLDICLECGFSDYRYMNKAFLDNVGCTPGEYKKKVLKDNITRSIPSPLNTVENYYSEQNTLNLLQKLRQKHLSVLRECPNPLLGI